MSVFTFLFIHSEHFCEKSFIMNEQKFVFILLSLKKILSLQPKISYYERIIEENHI